MSVSAFGSPDPVWRWGGLLSLVVMGSVVGGCQGESPEPPAQVPPQTEFTSEVGGEQVRGDAGGSSESEPELKEIQP